MIKLRQNRESHQPSHRREHGRRAFVIPVTYLFAIMTTLGLVMGWQAYQVLKQWHKPRNYFTLEAANQLIDCYVWCFVALAIWQWMRFFSLQGPKWKRDLAAHLGIAMVTAPVATFLYIGGLALSRLGKEDMSLESRLRWNLRAEFIPNMIEYLTILAILASVEYYRRYRDGQRETTQLQHALTESKLQTLRAQLNPHFLFNAMNSVSCLLHRDAAAADQMLSRVANLLRLTLARDDSREVGLLEEVELAEEYLEIQKIRFGSRMKLEIDIDDDVLDARVPNMLLQPLVENACVHGVARTRGDCRLEVRAKAESGNLVISIYNDGPPVRPDWKTHSGIGLRNTIERLSLLYKESSMLELGNFRDGVRLVVRVPLVKTSTTIEMVDPVVPRTPAHSATIM
ncbi:MAG TPA: histidine kinase [Terriglobales bacterium]|jgi:two-component system LytT family sensor kinase|nr:histidine kinase [Terriglobales bacterium]